ncbi:cell division protein FtsI (penicillin-binding protein 3)/stage V sporulation protein D (sporulation-specific penicillin-binding protein) [Fibrobacter sp. UWT3]|uniref:penicillin-binding protein n=1 Tax=Fibrobacter sp. UWT3 TaxID=1896225 RepID=UPI000BD2D23E|nr:penicillin-binding protein [Fibrobacter sp. UWT3]SOE79059.1 cell division protein FtsI (penicillin-binding protein 3)/stage V sporulation protein D (sporulation-specific penicillin-binding protein) [Fibrobacter sp. UWT3]
MNNKVQIEPLAFIKWLLMSLIAILAWQTINIQVVNREVYQTQTESMVVSTKNVHADRGRILDRNGNVFADNVSDSANNYSRLFLQGKLASQLIGKVGHDGKGSMGLELTFDEKLRGVSGLRVGVKDLYTRSREVAKAEPGMSLVLTIDKNIQEIVERELKDGVEEFDAKSASAVVVEPYTGEILAMASYPTFDPNSKTQGVGRMSKNDIVSMSYEPGSTFKVITAAAAIENKVVDPARIYENEGKCWKWNPKSEKICDTHIYGDMDMSEAMVQSSNIVFAKIADEVGADKLYHMARSFGFGMPTSEFFAGEENGRLLKPYELKRDDRTLKTMGFGHAVSVTPIQMAMAYAAVANGGVLMEPMIVREWRDAQDSVVEKRAPTPVRRVISESTASTIRSMLYRVVNSGTAKKVVSKKIPDVLFGGKTGTAEKFNQETQKYDRDHQVASFIGLAPVEDTRYVCLVLVDDPQGKHVGGLTAGPIFRRIMEGIYYNPETSPLSHNLAQVKPQNPCDVEFMGLTVDGAKKLADDKGCKVTFVGEGNRVMSQNVDGTGDAGIVLSLGNVSASRMPDLNGLSLRDAMEIMGNIRVNVEYEGKGRVVAQSPKPEEELRKGTICKLTLKERG